MIILSFNEANVFVVKLKKNINKRILDIKNLEELTTRFPEIKRIIELWFLNYNKEDEAIINGWANERAALKEIFKNKLK